MYQEYLAEVKRISKNVLERGYQNCLLNNDRLGESSTSGARLDGQPQQGLHNEGSRAESESNDTDEEDEETPPPKICGLREILDGMPDEWNNNDRRADDFNVILEEPKKPRITNPLAEILKGMPLVLDRRASLHARKVFFDELSKTLDKKLEKTHVDNESQTPTQTLDMQPAVAEVKPRRYTEMLDSMAGAVEGIDEKNFNNTSYSKRLDEMVQKSGDAGLIKSWTAKKKRQADRLAFRTRSQAQMVHSMINVKEFTDESKSYSMWLDNVAPTEENRHGSINDESATQTSENSSEQSEVGKSLREPRFREQSAANFLKNSLAEQILQEFSRSKTSKDGAQDKSADSNEPRFSEGTAANFLSAVSEQIREKFMDSNDQSQTSDQTEGPRPKRFREKSALKFLAALEEQLRPEFKNRHDSTSSERSEGGGNRFREKSAFNFLDALRDQILQSPNQIPPPDVPSSTDQSILSETARALENEVMESDQKIPLEDPDSRAIENAVGESDQTPPLEDPDSSALENEVGESDQTTPLEDPDSSATEYEVIESDQTTPIEDPILNDQSVPFETMYKSGRRNSK